LLHLADATTTDTNCNNDSDMCFLQELSHAVGLVLGMMHNRYESNFSRSPRSIRVSLNGIMVKYKGEPMVQQIIQRMSTMDKAMLAGESNEADNDLPASLIALNKEFGLSQVNDISFANVACFHFDRFIDPYEACRQYMLKASDLFEYTEPDGFIGAGDHLFHIPNKAVFQQNIHKLSAEIIIANNNILVSSGTKTVPQDNRRWYFVTSHGWGDCPAGCIYRRNFLFVYDRDLKKASLVAKNGNEDWYNYFTSLMHTFY